MVNSQLDMMSRVIEVGSIKVIKSPVRSNANDRGNSLLTLLNEGDRRGFGSMREGSKRKIWALESKNCDIDGIRHLQDDEEMTSTITSLYSSPSLEASIPAVLQDQEHSLRRPPPPQPVSSSDFEESNREAGVWTCVACTFVNTNPNFLSCEICSQNRIEEPADTYLPLKGRLTPANRDKFAAQQTCIQVQREKIAEVQERAILDERMREIIEMQQQLLAEIKQEQLNNNCNSDENNNNNNSQRSLSRSASIRSLQETQTKIDDLRNQLLRERSDQVHVELQLRASRRNIFQQQQQVQQEQIELVSSSSSSSEINEYLEQERMLHRWKGQWAERRESLTQISQFQKQLEDTCAQAFHEQCRIP